MKRAAEEVCLLIAAVFQHPRSHTFRLETPETEAPHKKNDKKQQKYL